MPVRFLSVMLAALTVAGCSGAGGTPPGGTEGVAFTRVDVSGAPLVLAADGDALLVGVRHDKRPGLLRLDASGTTTEVAVRPETPYAKEAAWYSIASDGTHIVGLGGERGGAHGNVRWSAWLGSAATGVAEHLQAFSTFGGYGAGEMIAAVQTTVGPALVGTWQSARTGLDAAVWTADGDSWSRRDSAGTALESTPDTLNFPIAATNLGPSILIAGWQLASGVQRPVLWRSTSGITGWTVTPLPDAGRSAAMSIRCWTDTCAIAGRVDGKLALWELGTQGWARVPQVPSVAVGDKDHLVPPVHIGGTLAQVFNDGAEVKLFQPDHATRTMSGPTGPVTATTTVGTTLYLLAGPDDTTQTLWHASLS
ncbi:MAG TPA: hypothetical protein VGR06_22525 [Actinophytocola sp.]|jgi:hypothetical protein|uniref:hypothetical protein n=1 Tax=Actinophytocola sp. TaxID=1872138 RepID=UPI002DFD8BFF|nr:hypothetical protein [Actinophytocola sp.]